MKKRCHERKYHIIYQIDRFDGKYYIGMHSTDVLEDGYFGSGSQLWKSINYHGKDKHTKRILSIFETRAEAIFEEEKLVTKERIKDPLCMNLVPGGASITKKPDQEQGRKNRIDALNAFYADPIKSAKARKKISERHLGKKVSEENKAVLSKTLSATIKKQKESGDWNRVIELNRLAHTGRSQSVETVSKRNASIKKTKQERYGGKYTFSAEARKNISESQRNNEKHAKTWILSMTSGQEQVIKNLAKWSRDNDAHLFRDGITIRCNKSKAVIATRSAI